MTYISALCYITEVKWVANTSF